MLAIASLSASTPTRGSPLSAPRRSSVDQSPRPPATIGRPQRLMKLLTAVVEIEGTAGLIALAVFAVVFGLVAFLAWMIVRNATASRVKDAATTWRFSTNVPLPLSKGAFDRVARAAPRAMSRPSLTTEQQQFVTGLAATRKKLARGVRLAFIVAGIGGIGLSIAIYRDYRDDEMILLPVGIIALLSLGAILNGIVPSRVVDPIEPIDPELFRNVHVHVGTPSLSVQLDEAATAKAIELLKRGLSPERVAREVTTGYERLSEAEQQQVQWAIESLRDR